MFDSRDGVSRISPRWWTAILLVLIVGLVAMTAALFTGTFNNYIPVLLTSDRSGLILESGGKVKMRGVQVGRVASVTGTGTDVAIKLELFPKDIAYLPANVGAQIKATTAFGAKYVELINPDKPSAARLSAGAVLHSQNVSTEVNTVFDNINKLVKKLDPMKLNAALSALADGLRGQGERIGQATTAANNVLLAVNPRMEGVAADWRAFGAFSDTYGAAAANILKILDNASTTAETISGDSAQLNSLLANSIGLAHSGIDVLGASKDNFVSTANTLVPTTDLLLRYQPEYTCTLRGAVWYLKNGGYQSIGGNGKSVVLDAGILFGDDPYRFPDNLPIVNAKGGPGGKPGCGSLPDPSKNFPVRALVTDTGFGTGLDWRPNPGIGHPFGVNFFPVTKGVPEDPRVYKPGPPAIGPNMPPGSPAYGAPLYTVPPDAPAAPEMPAPSP